MSKYYEKRPSTQVEHGSGVRGGGKYGITWWGQQWLNTFNQMSEQGRMAKGRAMAGNGSIRSFEISKNVVRASVMGSSKYSILMEFPPFTKFERIAIMDMVAERPDLISRLLTGELPTELLELCEERNIGIFPKGWKRFTLSCSCPDKVQPCKQVSAILYMIASEIDLNPFVIFDMRGLDFTAEIETAGLAMSLETMIMIPRAADLIEPMPEVREIPVSNAPTRDAIELEAVTDAVSDVAALLAERPAFYPEGDFKDVMGKTQAKIVRQLVKAVAKAAERQDEVYEKTKSIEIRATQQGVFTDFIASDADKKTLFEAKTIDAVIKWLNGVPPASTENLSSELRAMQLVSRYAETLVLKSAIVPQLLLSDKDTYLIRWIPATVIEPIAALHAKISSALPPYMLVYDANGTPMIPTEVNYATALISLFIGHYIKVYSGTISTPNVVFDMFFGGKPLAITEFATEEHPASIHLWLGRFYLTPKEEEE